MNTAGDAIGPSDEDAIRQVLAARAQYEKVLAERSRYKAALEYIKNAYEFHGATKEVAYHKAVEALSGS